MEDVAAAALDHWARNAMEKFLAAVAPDAPPNKWIDGIGLIEFPRNHWAHIYSDWSVTGPILVGHFDSEKHCYDIEYRMMTVEHLVDCYRDLKPGVDEED